MASLMRLSASSGALRSASFQRSVPSRSTMACCRSSQVMNASLPVCLVWIATPATLKVPSAAREMITSGPSTVRFESSGNGSQQRTPCDRRACVRHGETRRTVSGIDPEIVDIEGRLRAGPFRRDAPDAQLRMNFRRHHLLDARPERIDLGQHGITQGEVDAGNREIDHGDQHQKDFERPRQCALGTTTKLHRYSFG